MRSTRRLRTRDPRTPGCQSLLFSVSARDPAIYAAAAVLLMVAVMATSLPAWRAAASIPPSRCGRSDARAAAPDSCSRHSGIRFRALASAGEVIAVSTIAPPERCTEPERPVARILTGSAFGTQLRNPCQPSPLHVDRLHGSFHVQALRIIPRL